MGFVELGKLAEGIFAGDIGVQNEEGGVIATEDLFGELEWTGGAKGFGLDAECDVDVVLFFVLCEIATLAGLNSRRDSPA